MVGKGEEERVCYIEEREQWVVRQFKREKEGQMFLSSIICRRGFQPNTSSFRDEEVATISRAL